MNTVKIGREHLCRLIEIERKYVRPRTPPSGREDPFMVVEQDSPVLLSAPHGGRTFRNRVDEQWHPHDRYTASMALLLAEVCGTSAIATVRETRDHDPNCSPAQQSAYKQRLRRLLVDRNVKYVLDLHGLSNRASGMQGYLVDLGVRDLADPCLDNLRLTEFQRMINARFGASPANSVVSTNKRPAKTSGTVTSFVSSQIGVQWKPEAVQIEMKRSVRVPEIRNGLLCREGAQLSRLNRHVLAMIQALTDFVEYLHAQS